MRFLDGLRAGRALFSKGRSALEIKKSSSWSCTRAVGNCGGRGRRFGLGNLFLKGFEGRKVEGMKAVGAAIC